MQIEGGEKGNVEDRRGLSNPVAAGGGIMGLIVTALLVYGFGINPQQAQQIGDVAGRAVGGKTEQTVKRELSADEKKIFEFYRDVVGSTNGVWNQQFREQGAAYEEPTLVLFENSITTGCGNATSDVGPFYCPADRKLYLDTAFFKTLEKQLGGSASEFSQAYVVAHEVGHHVQNLLGYSKLVDAKRRGPDANDASVRLELQADYLAGCWAYHGGKKTVKIQPGDLDSALKSAHAIGDDKLQGRSGRDVNPQAFTHGTSAQRKGAFTDGFETGDTTKKKLDTFFSARSSQDLYRR